MASNSETNIVLGRELGKALFLKGLDIFQKNSYFQALLNRVAADQKTFYIATDQRNYFAMPLSQAQRLLPDNGENREDINSSQLMSELPRISKKGKVFCILFRQRAMLALLTEEHVQNLLQDHYQKPRSPMTDPALAGIFRSMKDFELEAIRGLFNAAALAGKTLTLKKELDSLKISYD